ncbi:MAG: hypothetical protein PF689_00045 [Deltaproteobacteria bacterium]|jgi:hypothetical protein|nr:hypothetical protein [Deltaproteobacteria bacterium]
MSTDIKSRANATTAPDKIQWDFYGGASENEMDGGKRITGKIEGDEAIIN